MDRLNATEFRFRMSNAHNRDMLEYQAERSFLAGKLDLAAAFAQSAGLYAVAGLLGELLTQQADRDAP